MRWMLAILALCLVACRTRIQPERESDFYGGAGFSGLPDVGASVTAGQWFSKSLPDSDFAFELRAAYQRGDDSPTQSGKFIQLQAGVKQVTAPGHTKRLFFRYGVTWLRATGDPNIFDLPGDYFGAFGAAGYEFYLTPRLVLSPEIAVNVVNGEGGTDWEVLPQVGVSLLFDF